MTNYQNLVNGKWKSSENVIAISSPINQEKLGTVPAMSQAEVDEAMKAARAALPAWRDLAPVERGQENDAYRLTYDQCSAYLKENNIRMEEDVVTHHIARPNNDRDVTIYGMAIDAYNRGEKISYDRLPDELKTHRNQTSFKDRFKVVEGNDEACHTVLAHLAKDGHYFIHPDRAQCRSITVREAARLQTFPDNFFFEGSRGEKFKQIGNAVPPMMAKAIAEEIKKQLL